MTPLSQMHADLEWAITSPSLLNGGESFEVSDLKSAPALLETHRVGHYFEALVEHWLREIQKFEITAYNHQVQDGKRTLGEVDFVFRNVQNVLTHWETAVKFYLCFSGESMIGSHFIGPNAADTLERKHARILEHQIPMGKRAFPDIEKQAAFVKGRIFYHPKDEQPPTSDLLAADHLRVVWIHESELEYFDEFDRSAGFQVLQKPFWLAPPVTPTLQTKDQIRQMLEAHFAKSDHPNLMSVIDENGNEIERVFVVSDAWPNDISV